MAKDIVGSFVKVVLNGHTFRVAADANVSRTPSAFTNEAIATSGGNVRKMIKRVEEWEGVTLFANGDEAEDLASMTEGLPDITMSGTNAAGDTYRSTGWINFDKHTSEDGKAEIKMMPRTGWEPFINP